MSGESPAPGAKSNFTSDPEVEATPCAYTDYREGETIDDLPATGEDATGVEADVWDALYGIEDPEMPISIVDLGLIYGVTVADGVATVDMTLTYSGCPARDMLTDEVETRVGAVDGVADVDLRLVWSPGWTVEMVTERGKDDLREFGLSI
ncbi:1,2-phenylacetyl-CoA epoxidase subunit PaaD [Halosolutus amylolyticus]|uniref:1,2-phenylacetyl-CoA epoxidase subunit PaaD n=1 Tax=Halosolutus amylolyticus TaxID=2932267 RepID=A0ABD5PL31_9EURY|nr:1,2-phenylacetyl-CoA epoxidase subunit PaaD [Halosolutus amylolyticus]